MKLTFGTILTLLWAFSSIKAKPAGGYKYNMQFKLDLIKIHFLPKKSLTNNNVI